MNSGNSYSLVKRQIALMQLYHCFFMHCENSDELLYVNNYCHDVKPFPKTGNTTITSLVNALINNE